MSSLTLSQKPLTGIHNKPQIETMVNLLVSSVEDGNMDPYQAITNAMKLELIGKTMTKKLKALDLNYDKGEFYGVEIKDHNSTTYDYSNDAEWSVLQTKITSLRELQKERETLLKSLKAPMFDNEGIEVLPAIKKSSSTIKLTISK